MAMRECWANVYSEDGISWLGMAHETPESAASIREPPHAVTGVVAVAHVKLKPEGAPRRYASEKDRWNWETYPEEMRTCPF